MLKNQIKFILQLALLVVCARGVAGAQSKPGMWEREPFDEVYEQEGAHSLYTIEGKIMHPDPQLHLSADWPAAMTLSINGGEYKGFVRLDGHFVISGVPSGSYILDTHHPDLKFQSLRVEISSTGKIRARKLSYLRPLQIQKLPYPLHLKPLGRVQYFRKREQWNIIDYVMSPMVFLMVLPLLLALLLPLLINDPETKREIEAMQFPKIPSCVPDMSDMLITLLGRNRGTKKPDKPKQVTGPAASKKRSSL